MKFFVRNDYLGKVFVIAISSYSYDLYAKVRNNGPSYISLV